MLTLARKMIKQNKKIFYKTIYILLLMMLLLNTFSGIASATQISSAQIVKLGDCGYHLQFWDTKQNAWSYVITTYVGYNYNGKTYPAYCMNSNLNGAEHGSYEVNISTLLDDVRIWRAITAGFPYRTASELGCSTDEDAFVATKHAVYSILYERNPETFYHGGDSRGETIKNAIVSLVNEGRYGTRTPETANVTVEKVGDLVKDGNYYYQEMCVNSFVNIGNYTITEVKRAS